MALAIGGALVFLSYPQIDLVIERQLHSSDEGFLLNRFAATAIVRKTVLIAYVIWYSAITLMLILSIIAFKKDALERRLLQIRQLVYLFVASLVGPLLIANIILKDNWGRARPREVIEFGGTSDFSPPLLMTDQCPYNCSFVSGEPSSMFMIFISLAFIFPAKRKLLVLLSLIMGSLSGFMRMGQGGHFFSDVYYSGLFMALTAAVIFWLFFLRVNSKATA